jgi:hypothetical protein
MNKKKLLELSDTLRGIAEGEEWEYCCFIGPNEQWFSSMTGTDPLSMAARGQNIRLKQQPPPPDPYEELKAAHSAGKTIQCEHWSKSHWFDLAEPQFTAAPSSYRIKPEPRKVPLGPDDVMPGSVIDTERGIGWVSISSVVVEGINMPTESNDVMLFTWEEIMENDTHGIFQINRSIPLTGKWDKDAWEPCYKFIEE